MIRITALNVYPVKGCRGIALDSARVAATGFEHDREWLIVRPDGRFMTQREEPRLALIETALIDTQSAAEEHCGCAFPAAPSWTCRSTARRAKSKSRAGRIAARRSTPARKRRSS